MSTVTEQIKERIDLVELIREYAPELKKAGTNWKARCPFHQEKTPSFIVSPEKGLWHCFGCGAGGDHFAFIQRTEGLEFPDALRLLAQRAGIKLQAQNREAESERGRLLEILNLSSRWYHQALLRSRSGEAARSYLKDRGLTEKTVSDWQLGFAPDAWDELLKYLQSRGLRESEIVKTGLIASNNRGGYYDRFRYRLLFPISDAHGNVVGFTARKLREEDQGGKYINTPETALYHKSQVLYGLSYAKPAIRSAGLAVVVEGNMDCISSHQAGITNVVAASGTALTPEQIKLLKRFTKTICLAFDADSAGQTALRRGLETAWQEDMTIQVAPLPPGLDPDALIRKNPGEWRERIANRQNFMDWLFAKTKSDYDLATGDGKKQAGRILLIWIRRLPDAIEQTHYLQRLAHDINVAESVLRGILDKHSRPRTSSAAWAAPTIMTDEKQKSISEKIALRLLALALSQEDKPLFLTQFFLAWLPSQEFVNLYKSLDFFYDSRTAAGQEQWLTGLPVACQPLARAAFIAADELRANLPAPEAALEMERLQSRLKNHYLQRELNDLRKKIKQAEVSGQARELQEHLVDWKRLSAELNKV